MTGMAPLDQRVVCMFVLSTNNNQYYLVSQRKILYCDVKWICTDHESQRNDDFVDDADYQII